MSTETTNTMNDAAVADEWAQALEEQAGTTETVADSAPEFEANTAPAAGAGPMQDIQMVLDIPVQLSVELDGLAGEPMDVLVNGCLIAQGEVVVVNDKFGIRLTDIITPSERMQKLNR